MRWRYFLSFIVMSIAGFGAVPASAQWSLQCPAGHFEARGGSNAILGSGANVAPLICISIRTTPAKITTNVRIAAMVTGIAGLQDQLRPLLLSSTTNAGSCGGDESSWRNFLTPHTEDVRIEELELQFVRRNATASVRVTGKLSGRNAAIRFESRLTGDLAGEATVTVTSEGDNLRFGVRNLNVRVSGAARYLLGVSSVRNALNRRLSSCINQTLAGYQVNPYRYIQSQPLLTLLKASSPRVDSGRLVYVNDRLSVIVDLSAELNKPDADRMLKEASSRWSMDDIINLFKGRQPTGPTS